MILKHLALGLKIPALVFWVGLALFTISWDIREMHTTRPPRDAPNDWGLPSYFHRTYCEILVLSLIALLSLAPNRLFVFSPVTFATSLVIALFPFGYVLFENFSQPFATIGDFFSPENLMFMICFFGPLPLSLTFSFWRKRRGEQIGYA